jgi:uncharacterized phiE125 gp8 family phage protein
MPAILLVPPAIEPITLAEAKLYLRVEHDDDDTLIAALIKAAREQVETRTRRALITQQWRFVRDAWPSDGRLSLPLVPLRSVIAARVYDQGGVAHAIDTQAFVIDAAPAPAIVGFTPWALTAPGRGVAGIELDVEVGYGAVATDVPEPLRQAIRFLLAHWYENRGLAAPGQLSALPATADVLLAPYRVLSL